MFSDDTIDEDLEALLYAQVYYGKSDGTDVIESQNIEQNIQNSIEIEGIEKLTSLNKNLQEKEGHFENVLAKKDTITQNKESLDKVDKSVNEYIAKSNADQATDLENSINEPPRESNQFSENIEQIHLDKVFTNQNSQTLESFLNKDQVQENPSCSNYTQIEPQFLENVDVNQYTYSPSFLKRLDRYNKSSNWSTQCQAQYQADLNKLQNGHLTVQAFFNKLRRRKRNHLKKTRKKQDVIKRIINLRRKDISESDVIVLSDSEDEVVEVKPTSDNSKQSQRMTEENNTSSSLSKENQRVSDGDEDDEIIYIAPPPVPVIHIDTESDSSESADKHEDLVPEKPPEGQTEADEASNDFLTNETQPASNVDNFNFSLHGSDFQNSDFVRPANPTDLYETESSTSTSDFNKDSTRVFSNTVKTIVFNEVEFPKEDIFTESNLESFGELITPKRSVSLETTNRQKSVSPGKKSVKNNKKRTNPRTSSESSSESEYETSVSHSNLPYLSPVVGADASPKKGKKGKKAVLETPKEKRGKVVEKEEIKDRSSKKKKKAKNVTNEEEMMENHLKRSLEDTGIEAGLKKKMKKKKKKKASPGHISPGEDNEIIKDSLKACEGSLEQTQKETNTSAKKDLLRTPIKNCTDTSSLRTGADQGDILPEEFSKKKNKKKKKKGASVISNTDHQGDNEDIGNFICQKDRELRQEDEIPGVDKEGSKKKIKKKRKVSSDGKSHQDDAMKLIIDEDQGISSERETYVSCNIDTEIIEKHTENSSAQDSQENLERDIEDQARRSPRHELENTQNIVLHRPDELSETIIIIDETVSCEEDEIHTIDSSDSDEDFQTFDDVGHALQLANTKLTGSEDVIIVENESFDVENIKKGMSDDPEKWKVSPLDRFRLNIAKRGPRCNRCRQFGHMALKCPNKPTPPNCSLCGRPGHQEPRCPNKICLSCGNPGSYSTIFCWKCSHRRKSFCSLCVIPGHRAEFCPDLWRRYYLTTKEGPLVTPKKGPMLKPKNKQWCSGCAKQGHLEFECDSYKWHREYPVASPRIFKYKDVYESGNKTTDQHSKTSHHPCQKPEHTVVSEDLRESLQNDTVVREENQSNQEFAKETGVLSKDYQDESITKDGEIAEIQVKETGDTYKTTSEPNQTKTSQQQNKANRRENVTSQRKNRYNLRSNASKNQSNKINPVSVANRSIIPSRNPFQNVLNPYSVFNAVPNQVLVTQMANLLNSSNLSNVNQNQNIPSILDIDLGVPNFYENPVNINNFPSFSNYGQTTDAQNYHQYNLNAISNLQLPINSSPFFDNPSSSYRNEFGNLYFDYGDPNLDYRPQNNYNDLSSYPNDYRNPINSYNDQRVDYRFANDLGTGSDNYYTDISGDVRLLESNFGYLQNDSRSVQNDFPAPIEIVTGPDYSGGVAARNPHCENVPQIPEGTCGTSRNYVVPPKIPRKKHKILRKAPNIPDIDQTIIRKFNQLSVEELQEFLNLELEKLKKLTADPKLFRKKLTTIDHLKKIEVKSNGVKKQIYFLYKQVNMFLFGVHQLNKGKRYLEFLRHFLHKSGNKLKSSKRRALLVAYSYIFGGEHPGMKYKQMLNNSKFFIK